MRKTAFILAFALFFFSIFSAGCGETQKPGNHGAGKEPQETGSSPEPSPLPSPEIDLFKVLPNENGKIMVVMFHNFIEKYESGDQEYTTTYDNFRSLLKQLYDRDYRLISMSAFLNNDISVPAGCIPMLFTFDDGTPGQFRLINENGVLKAAPDSAVGILEDFSSRYPDFGLQGTFYVNLGLQTFEGEGTMEQRLRYLSDKGFEIGNHTYSHINLNETENAGKILQEIGSNQQAIEKLIPGYKMKTFSLPYGAPSNSLMSYVIKGNWRGTEYEHAALMEVGWDPSVSPVSKAFNPMSIHRVRASGIKPVLQDLGWWLENLSMKEQYVSDGNRDTITVPAGGETGINQERLGEKKLVTY